MQAPVVRPLNPELLLSTPVMTTRAPYKSRGVSMIEVLVAMVVLAIGMLGTATLYTTALQAKTTAKSRMHAVNLANDIADRIRANRTAGTDYELALTTVPSEPAASANCIQSTSNAVQCSAAQMAAADLFNWYEQVNQLLPGEVTRSIDVAAVAGTGQFVYTITLNWTEASSGANTLSHILTVRI